MNKIFFALMSGFIATAVGAQTPPPPAPAAQQSASVQEEKKQPSAEEREQARKATEAERVKERERARDELMKLCIIKPVMSDDEINACKKAYKA